MYVHIFFFSLKKKQNFLEHILGLYVQYTLDIRLKKKKSWSVPLMQPWDTFYRSVARISEWPCPTNLHFSVSGMNDLCLICFICLQIDNTVMQQFSLSPGSPLAPVRILTLGRIRGEFQPELRKVFLFAVAVLCTAELHLFGSTQKELLAIRPTIIFYEF